MTDKRKDDGSQKKVRLAVIGLGSRGQGLLKNLLDMEDVDVAAVSDLRKERLDAARKLASDAGRKEPAAFSDHRELLARDDVEGVIIGTGWISHISVAIDAMRAGVYAAPEVGGACSLAECRDLVRTSEETGVPCMMLENCCFGRNELALLNMAGKGLFGELVHCQCGYQHDLREHFVRGGESDHFRIDHNIHRNGDLYPTHGIGPVAKMLGINRGNRFLTLNSIASKARGLKEWAAANLGENHPMSRIDYAKGDIVTTMIRCAHGESVLIIHDTSLPRPYSRGGRIQGTRGIWMEDSNSIYVDGESPPHEWEPFDDYLERYEHPLWTEFRAEGVRGGHGGMDYLTLRAFAESVKKKEQTPIDVYDTAVWRAITVLSEQSVAMGGATAAFPDFTNGRWVKKRPAYTGKYSLERV